jgi:hypothetical protein
MDLSFLRALYDLPGPFASVYLDMRRTSGARAVEVHRRVRCKELADEGAPPETIAAVDRAVQDRWECRESGCLAIFACGDRIAYQEVLAGPPREEVSRYAPLPHVAPLLAQRGEPVSHLVAVVNRLGARLTCVPADGPRWDVEVPPSAESPVHKPKGGDMFRQPHVQQAAEESWHANAKKTARAIDQAVGAHGFELVVIAGDVRARAALLDHLSEPVRARAVETAAGGPALAADVAATVRRARTARMASAAERFAEQLTKGRRAVDGLPAVVGALRNAQVASLLIDDRADPGIDVWTGPRCTDLATAPDDLRERGVTDPVPDRADAALIRALVATDGELLLIDLDGWRAHEGVGALLRFGDRVPS